MQLSFTLNGNPVELETDPTRPLLDVLRKDLKLTGAKQGCDHEGECGACTVLLDGKPVRSCLTPVGKVAGRQVLTVEGLGQPDALHPLQEAFIEVGAVQCGYCTPGMLIAAKALLDEEPNPTQEQIVTALAGNLCRCTGYKRIVQAVQMAAARLRGENSDIPDKPTNGIIGGNNLRTDSLDKVTGQARYVEDITLPGMTYARVLRSPHHHARLMKLDASKAEKMEGVIAVITAADIPGKNALGDYSQDEPILTPVGDTVKMRGAPVALVVADSPDQAQAGMEAIRASYQPLPHTFDLAAALAEDAAPIYPRGNVLTSEAEAHGDLEASFAAADVILESHYTTAWQEHAALERESLLGYFDEEDRLTVMGGTHEPHWQQGYIAASLDMEVDSVRVIMPPTGGSFGGKQDPWPFIATALAVHYAKRPVQLVYSRRESFEASPKRHPYRVHYQLGATNDGHLTGIHVRVDANTGGYDGHGQYIANYALTASGGPYRYQAVDAYTQSVYTNGPKGGQFRGFGSPESMFALECTLDEMAQVLGQDPLSFRRINAIEQDSISFLGYPVAESLGYQEVLDAIEPHYQEAVRTVDDFNQAHEEMPIRMGVGFAGMWYRFGKSGSLKIEAHAELGRDGSFVIFCSAPDYGQGTNTAMAQIAAETLDVSRDQVDVINADTAHSPDSGIQGASRATYFVGNAVSQAAQVLKQAIFATAAEMLDCHPADLTLQDKHVVCERASAEARLHLADVAAEIDRMGKSRRVPGVFDLTPIFPMTPGRNISPCLSPERKSPKRSSTHARAKSASPASPRPMMSAGRSTQLMPRDKSKAPS